MNMYKIILIAIIHRNNKQEILLVKRNREPGYGMWSLVGGVGALENEKDPFVAIKREVEGEFKVDFINYSLLDVKYQEEPEPILRFYYYGQLSDEPKEFYAPTTKEIKWFSVKEALDISLAFEEKDKEEIRKFCKIA